MAATNSAEQGGDRPVGTLDEQLEHAAGSAVSLQALFTGDDRLLIASAGLQPFLYDASEGFLGYESLRRSSADDGSAARELWQLARDGGNSRGDVTVEGIDGHARVMEMSLVRLEHGARPGDLLLQMHDVTAQRAAERRIAESERLLLLGRLAGRVAHEINNPLGGIKNAATLLRRLGHKEADRERYVDTIDREVDNIARVVRQLYETLQWGDVSRLDASLPEVIQAALNTLQGSRSDVAVDVHIEPEARRVAAPEAVVRLVVYTVLRNALNASPDGSTVAVRGRRVDQQVILRIEDEGVGIPEGQREGLLRQPPAARHGARQRSDLIFGLPFARQVLEVFNGSIAIEATGKGGAAFVTRWPLT